MMMIIMITLAPEKSGFMTLWCPRKVQGCPSGAKEHSGKSPEGEDLDSTAHCHCREQIM